MPTAAAGWLEKQFHPAGAIHLLNDILAPQLGTAPAVGALDPVCVLPSGRAWFEHMIRDRRDCGLSLDGSRMPNGLQRGCAINARPMQLRCANSGGSFASGFHKKRERNDLPSHVDRCSLPRKVVV